MPLIDTSNIRIQIRILILKWVWPKLECVFFFFPFEWNDVFVIYNQSLHDFMILRSWNFTQKSSEIRDIPRSLRFSGRDDLKTLRDPVRTERYIRIWVHPCEKVLITLN